MAVSHVRSLATVVSIVTVIVLINVNDIIVIKVYQRLNVFVHAVRQCKCFGSYTSRH